MPVKGISVIGRNTQGVRLINLDEGDKVIDVARVVIEDEAEAADLGDELGGDAVDDAGDRRRRHGRRGRRATHSATPGRTASAAARQAKSARAARSRPSAAPLCESSHLHKVPRRPTNPGPDRWITSATPPCAALSNYLRVLDEIERGGRGHGVVARAGREERRHARAGAQGPLVLRFVRPPRPGLQRGARSRPRSARILGSTKRWRVALVGAGNIGSALFAYKEFGAPGLRHRGRVRQRARPRRASGSASS